MSDESLDRKRYEVWRKLHHSSADLNYSLEVFGDYIAKREGYHDIGGFEAIHFYLIHKFRWMPHQVRAMSFEDLRFVLHEELATWSLPKDAVF